MLKPTNPDIKRHADALLAACKRLDRGDTLPHEEIEQISGTTRNTPDYQYLVWNKLDRQLQDTRGIALILDRTVGYKLCTKNEQLVEVSRRRRRRAARQLLRSQRAVESLPADELSEHQRNIRAHQIRLLRQARNAVNRDNRTDWDQVNGGGVPPHPHSRKKS